MNHVDPPTFDALSASRSVSPRASLHIDRCVRCRHVAAERGIAAATIAAGAAAARVRGGRVRGAAVIAACVTVAVAALPLRGTALGFISVFEPHTVTAVPLTLDELRSLNRMSDLSAYASTRQLRESTANTFTDPRAAAAAAGFALREPTAVPNGLRADSYLVNGPSGQLVTFASHSTGADHVVAALPADIAASTLRVDFGSTVVATYQTPQTIADEARMARAFEQMNAQAASEHHSVPYIPGQPGSANGRVVIQARSASTLPSSPRATASYQARIVNGRIVADGAGSGDQPRVFAVGLSTRGAAGSTTFRVSHGWRTNTASGWQGMMPLVVVQMPVPRVASTGVSVQRIVSYMLSAPGVPPRVAAAFGALGDISTTLPIPVPVDKAFTQPVIVDGVTGVGIGDNTGLGASVIWQKNGMLYAVFATEPAQQVLAIANSLR